MRLTATANEKCGRRAAVAQAAVVAGHFVALGGAVRVNAESDAAGNRVVPADDMEFHQQWSYAKPQDILPYIYASAKEGQIDEILKAMDEFGRQFLMEIFTVCMCALCLCVCMYVCSCDCACVYVCVCLCGSVGVWVCQ